MVKLLFCGDFVSQNPRDIKVDDRLHKLFQSADIVSCNFEAPIRGVGKPIAKCGPSLTQSEESPAFLEKLGVNIIQLANNHMMDMGKNACEATKQAFSSNVTIIGAGQLPDAHAFKVVEIDDLKIGLLSLTHKEFGTLTIDSRDEDYGTAWINHPLVNRMILQAKSQSDYLIILPHAGVEDVLVPLPEWRSRYKELIDFGADAIIASHPHTPQGWEEYNGKMIYYSLGNFFFQSLSSNHAPNWYKSQIVELNIGNDKSINFRVHNARFSDTELMLDDSSDANDYNTYLCSLLYDESKYYKYLNKTLGELWETYKLYLLRGMSGFSFRSSFNTILHCGYGLLKGADIPLLINNFQCESHLWAIERMLRLRPQV